MNPKTEFKNRTGTPFRNLAAVQPALLWPCLAALALVLNVPARAQTFTDADWVSLGSGVNGAVNALAVSGTNLYAGGEFTTAGGVTATYIAQWNGSSWSALGTGMNSEVYALAVIGTNLYVGGQFGTAGGVAVSGIAQWDGSVWSAAGYMYGNDPYVLALAVSGTNLYAGGGFTGAGPVLANNIAEWDGSAWSAVGGGMLGYYIIMPPPIPSYYGSAQVAALAVSGTNLYAGGCFNEAGGVTVTNIAMWDGTAWSALGSGIGSGNNDPVCALAAIGTNLYVGGEFTNAGGVLANNIAKWDGSAWSALGSGISGGLYPYTNAAALAADGAGQLFVGGDFTLAGTNVCPYIAEAILVPSIPTILIPPQTQTAEAGATVYLEVDATTGEPPPAYYQWYFNGTNNLSSTTSDLVLTNLLISQSGSYTVVVTNVYGAVTSTPAMLNVIPAVERRPAPAINLMGEVGASLNVEYTDALGTSANWLPLDTVNLTNPPEYCFDVAMPLPPQRFYRVWQSGTPSMIPSLNFPGMVPAITLTGNIGDSLQLDYINQFGPTNAWVTLDMITLTNTSQLYFDVSAIGQPPRLYQVVPVP